MTLFEIEPKPNKPVTRCRTCEFIYTHEYKKSMKYCIKQKDKTGKTAYGNKKIKANDSSCILYQLNK